MLASVSSSFQRKYFLEFPGMNLLNSGENVDVLSEIVGINHCTKRNLSPHCTNERTKRKLLI